MNDNLLINKCPNGCTSLLEETKLHVSEGVLRKCSECGQLISSCNKSIYQASNQEWDTEEGTWPSDKDYARLFHRRKRDFKFISKILKKQYTDIHLLDVGCSNGSSVYIANKIGIHAEGVEPTEKSARNGIKRGLKIHLGFLHEIQFPENNFDAISLYEVIEHIADPVPLLKECHRVLRPGGVLLIGTGNTDSWTYRFRKEKWDFFDMNQHGGHINFYSNNSIKALAKNTNFTLVKIRTSSVKFYEKHEVSLFYRLFKIGSELLNLPSKLFKKGHQMEVFLVTKK